MPSFGHVFSPSQIDDVIAMLMDSEQTGEMLPLDHVSIENLEKLDVFGFGGIEEPYPSQNVPQPARWMTSDSAEICLRVRPTENPDRSLRLRLRSLATRQTIRVWINDSLLGTLRPGEDWLAWKSKPVVLKKGRNVLRFEANAYEKPPGDPRHLYVLFDRLTLSPSDAPHVRSARHGSDAQR